MARRAIPVPICLTAGLLALLGLACGDDEAQPARPTGTRGTLTVQNSAGRSGSYYLPPDYEGETHPLLLLYHGTGGDGASILDEFRSWADARGVILVAPSSRVAPNGAFSWEVGAAPGSRTEDYFHTLACIDEVLALPGVSTDPARWLAAGFSGGASSAPYFATNDARFTAFAVLHGGVFAENLGSNVIRGWLSTGQDDELRPPDMIEGYVEEVGALGFSDLTYRVYAGGHVLSALERSELIEWWLGPE